MLGSEPQAWNASNSGRTRQFAAQSRFIGSAAHQLGAVGGELLTTRLGFDQLVVQDAFGAAIALPLVIEVYAWHDQNGGLSGFGFIQVGALARRSHDDLSGQLHHLAIFPGAGLIGEFMAAAPHGVGRILCPHRRNTHRDQDTYEVNRLLHFHSLLGTMKKGGTRPPLVTGFETGD